MSRYRAAVVGAGRMGVLSEADPKRKKPATHAGAYAANADTELCALVDPSESQLAAARQLLPDVPGFADLETMLAEAAPDIVSVATTQEHHRSIVETCAAHGVKAIVCEKPIAETIEDGRAMIAACRTSGSLLFVNHMRRFDPLTSETRDAVRGGALGEILQGNAQYVAGIFTSGTHLIDQLRYFLGDVRWVSAVFEERFAPPPGDWNVNGIVMFEGDVPVTIQALDVAAYNAFDVRLFGRRGKLLIDRLGLRVTETPLRECVDYSGFMELDTENERSRGDSRSFWSSIVDHVLACLEGRDENRSSGEDGLAALQGVVALKKSAEAGGARVALADQ